MQTNFQNLHQAIQQSLLFLKQNGQVVKTRTWQSINAPSWMFEVMNLNWTAPVPRDLWDIVDQTKPDIKWADIHFEERISGKPLNPGESYKSWPGYNENNVEFNDTHFRKYDGKFAHTYMERYWPKKANDSIVEHSGIRFPYGDLEDVVNQLYKEPLTRQAFLPIFFPEDTGAAQGQRVPCTLGYLFYMRESKVHIKYYMRSCDALRHFRNDIYLTCALLHWMVGRMNSNRGFGPDTIYQIGNITVDIASFHVFEKEKNLI